jgi:hypothetical protein
MSSWIDHPLQCDCLECAARDPRYAGRRGMARSLIEQLVHRGVSFRLVGSKVRFRPSRLVTEEERAEIRRVRDELYELILRDEKRRTAGEGNVRDVGEVFDMARDLLDRDDESGAA